MRGSKKKLLGVQALGELECRYPSEPWKWKAEWIDPRGIPPRTSNATKGCLYVCGIAMAGSVALVSLASLLSKNGDEVRHPGNWVPVLFFGAVVGVLLFLAKRQPPADAGKALARFVPLSLPVPLGGVLTGMVVVPRPVTPKSVGRMTLSCRQRELIEESHRGHRREREQDELMGDTTERAIPLEDWKRSGAGSEVFVRMPVRGGKPSTPFDLDVDRPVIEWVLRVETRAAEGKVALEFVLPVFSVAKTGHAFIPEALEANADAEASESRINEAVAGLLDPPDIAPDTWADRNEAFLVANVRLVPHPGAVGGDALVLDPAAVSAATKLAWQGILILVVILAILVGVLFSIPLIGWLLALVVVLRGGAAVGGGIRDIFTQAQGPETLWVEDNVVHVEDRKRRIRRLNRSAIARLEVVWVGEVGERQYFSLVAAGPPDQAGPLRPRQTIVQSVRSREAAQAVGHWLGGLLTAPPPAVVNAERGLGYIEKLSGKLGKRRRG